MASGASGNILQQRLKQERLNAKLLEEEKRRRLQQSVPPVTADGSMTLNKFDPNQGIVMLGQNDPNLPRPQQPFNPFQSTGISEEDRLAVSNAAMNQIPLIKRPSSAERFMGGANEMMGDIDEGVGKFFGETGPIDRFKQSNIGGLLGGFIDRAGGLMGDPAFRGFAGMMDESSYVDKQGFGGGGFIGEIGKGLSSAGGLYDAAVKSQATRTKARADLLAAQGRGQKPDKTVKQIGDGFEAREFVDKNGRKKWMLSVASGMRPKWHDLQGEQRFGGNYKKNKAGVTASSRLEGMIGNSVDDLREKYARIKETEYGGNVFLTGAAMVKTPPITSQYKMMDEIRNAKESLTMLHSVLGTGHAERLKTGGLLKESFVGAGGSLVAGVAGGVAELAQLAGQPNWLQDTKAGKTRELQTVMAKIKAGLWRSLVGRGQLSAADYKFIDDNLGVFSWGKDEGLVRFSLGKVVDRLERVIGMNTYLLSKGKATPEAIALEWSKYDAGQPSLIDEGAAQGFGGGQYSPDKAAHRSDDLSRSLFPSTQKQWEKKRNTSSPSVLNDYNTFTGAGSAFKQRGGPKYTQGSTQEEAIKSIITDLFK